MHAAPPVNPPDVPDAIKPPAGEQLLFRLRATGTQNYVCQAGADGNFAWTLKAPEADLRDEEGTVTTHHFAGPTWQHKDGSEITGKVAAKVDAPDKKAIPWLLLSVTGHKGEGVFSRVTSIQRVHTEGGQAPSATGCDSTQKDIEVKVAYNADYYFYAPAK